MEALVTNAGAGRRARRDEVTLELPARPESLAVARRAVTGLGERLGLSGGRLDDLRTLVTEACANAAAHAYPRREGTMKLRAVPRGDELMISVTDEGRGIDPRPATDGFSGRLGLLLMAALATKVEISGSPRGGTRVRLRFPLEREPRLA